MEEKLCLDREDEDGETRGYDIPSPENYYAADSYDKIRDCFLDYVKERNAKLVPLAELLMDELTKSEAARELGLATSTVGSRAGKLKELLKEFLDNIVSL